MALSLEEKKRAKEILASGLKQLRQEKYEPKRELEFLQKKCSHERPATTSPFSSYECIHCGDDDE